jgi:ubiquinone/menaquinone biosynthesis C-methylase UbiE
MNKPWREQDNDHDFFEPDHVAVFLRQHRTGTDNFGRAALARIVDEHGPDTTVLDAACGTAVNWEVFKNFGVRCQYTGFDRTQQFLDHAAKLYGDEIKLQHGFIQELPYEDNSFDVVILRHVIEHLGEGYGPALSEALRVARKEVVLVLFLSFIPGNRDSIEKRGPNEKGHYHYWNQYSVDKFDTFLRSIGAEITDVKNIMTPGAAHADTIMRIRPQQ